MILKNIRVIIEMKNKNSKKSKRSQTKNVFNCTKLLHTEHKNNSLNRDIKHIKTK